MSIKMTIEVTPEQAVKIADLLSENKAVTVAPAPAPVSEPIPAPMAEVAVHHAAPAAPVAAPAPAPQAVPAVVPTATKTYTMDELSLASRPIVEANRQQELLDFLHSFVFTDANGVQRNVQNLRELPPEQYGAFANGIRQMGGKI